MGKGKYPEVGKSMSQEKGKNIFVKKRHNEKFLKACGRKHNLKTCLSNKVQEATNVCGVTFGDWDPTERLRSSTWRESETVRSLINSNVIVLQNKKIKIFCVNENVQSILQIGSRKRTYKVLLWT